MSNKKTKPILFILPLVIFISLVVVLFSRLGESNQVEVSTSINRPIPSFSLPALKNAEQIMSNKDLPKEPYLLNVWGTWCIACSREHPILVKQKNKGTNIVGINYKDEREYAQTHLEQEGNPYSMNIYDEEGGLGIELGLTGAPETFVVDEDGIIRQHFVGEITDENWESRIEPCLTAVKAKKTEDDLRVICH